jgi:hypothetical protein
MKNDYEIQAPSRVCSVTGQPIAVGERFYAALVEEAGKFIRKDFSLAAWNEPPSGTIAHWCGKIPTAERNRKPSFNDELLLNCFRQLADTPELHRQKFRYVLALLLMRRRRLKFEDMIRDDQGTQFLIVRDAQSGARSEVLDPHLPEEEIGAVQDEVFQVLGWQ